ncbi:MAG: dockerin type I repeat-containing protein [Oscillospiraceae bacterium]|nr:dockerin type I repeat-containing protein [Oscillospiraceae bacterium]
MMKKLFAAMSCLSVLLSFASLPATAEDAVPANLEEAVYSQLLKDSMVNVNKDDILTEQELHDAKSILLSLDGVTDLSWMNRLQSATYVHLRGGELTDLTMLTQIPHLRNLQLSGVPVTDISFTKQIPLETFRLDEMPQITLEQRLSAMRCADATVQQGFSAEIGALPIGLLEGFYDYYDVSTTITDDTVAVFDYQESNPAFGSTFQVIYGVKPGTTSYTITAKDEVLFTGTITVKEDLTPVQDPPLHGELTETPEIRIGSGSSPRMVRIGTDLYAIENGEVTLAEQNVRAMGFEYYSEGEESFLTAQILLLTNGKVKVDGKPISQTVSFADYDHDRLITKDGGMYDLRYVNGSFVPEKVANDFASFIDPYASYYYVNKQGEVIFCTFKEDDNGKRTYTCQRTGIMHPTSAKNDLFVDENSVLWRINRTNFSVTKVAEDVAWVGYHEYDGGKTYGCVHVMKDGTAYAAGTTRKVELYEKPAQTAYLESGRIGFGTYYSDAQEMSRLPNYHLTNDHTLCLYMEGETAAITNVAAVIGGDYDENADELYTWFIRTDGSFWRYAFRAGKLTEMPTDAAPTEPTTAPTTEPEIIRGDVNGDGAFDLTDLVAFQKWLHCVPGAALPQEKRADLNEDGTLDVFDLALMKRALTTELQAPAQ